MHILKIIVLQRHDYNWRQYRTVVHQFDDRGQFILVLHRIKQITFVYFCTIGCSLQNSIMCLSATICFVFFIFCHRPTLSHVQSVAISNRNTSCVASVMLRFAKKLLWFASKYSQWRVAHWELQPWKRLFYMRGRPPDKLTKTNGL